MKDGLTVIVPAYNVEQYLRFCVSSINNSTKKPNQIIIIDDCSTDNTLLVAKELETEFDNIEVYHNEINLISKCRYEGFKHIKHRFVTFCDSDDCVDKEAYELLLRAAKETGADVVSFSSKIDTEVISGTEKILEKHFLEGKVSICNLLVDTSRIDLKSLDPYSNEIDTLTSYKIFSKCNKWAVISGAYYNYRQQPNTVSRSKFSIKDFRIIDNINIVNNDIEKVFPNLLFFSYNHLLHAKLDLISKYAIFGAETLNDKVRIKHAIKSYKTDLKRHSSCINKSQYFTSNEKIKAFLIIHFYFAFYIYSKFRFLLNLLPKKEKFIKI